MPTLFKDKVEVPPFFLSIIIYGKSLHNCLIDLGDSCNVMPLLIARRLGLTPQSSNIIVIKLDKIEVKVIGMLKDVYIQLTIDPQIQDIIEIHAVGITDSYRLLLSK